MPLDPSIPLRVKTPMIDLAEIDAKRNANRTTGMQQKLLGLQTQKAEQDIAQQPMEEELKRIQLGALKLDSMSRALDGVVDQQTWDGARRKALVTGILTPQQLAELPEQYDAPTINSYRDLTKQGKEQLAQKLMESQIEMNQARSGQYNAQANYYGRSPGAGTGGGKLSSLERIAAVIKQDAAENGENISDTEALKRAATVKESGKVDIGRQAGKTKAESALKGFEQQSDLVVKNIDKALNEVSVWSTGFGSYLAPVPNFQAGKLQNYLNTIKANIGFDKIQNMRDSSPTGGALGQVSDFENKLLQAVNGALDPKQPDQLVENLNTIRTLYPKVLAEKRRAFEQDYGNVNPTGNNPQPTAPAKGIQDLSDDELLMELSK